MGDYSAGGRAGHRSPVRVVIVDDHALVREGAGQLLGREPGLEVAGLAGTAEEGLRLIRRLRPQVAIVDVNLPDKSGLELCRELSRDHPEVSVLVVSAYDEYAYVTEAIDAGVAGYLLKTASGPELIDAVHLVADGVLVLDRGVSRHLARRRWGDGKTDPRLLTPRESDVLAQLARGASNKQIATTLGLRLRTVEGHVSSLLAKLGVESRTEAVAYAVSHNLVGDGHHGGPARPR